jgi:hypothetical protein
VTLGRIEYAFVQKFHYCQFSTFESDRISLQSGDGSALAPPVGECRVGLVAYGRQVRRLQTLHSLERAVGAGNQQAAGQQRSLDGIMFLTGEEHLLGVVDERAEKTCQRGAGRPA